MPTFDQLLIAAVGSIALCSCLNGVNFDAIEPECERPSFDVRSRDVYCSGENLGPRTVATLETPGQLMGLSRLDSKVLVVAGERPFPQTVVFENYRLWAVDEAMAGDGLPLPVEAGVTQDLSSLLVGYVPPILGAHLVSARHSFAMLNVAAALQPVSVEPGAPPFDPVMLNIRTPQMDNSLFLDVAAMETVGGLTVFASVGGGLKVLRYKDTAGGWVEHLPQIQVEGIANLDALGTFLDELPADADPLALLDDPGETRPGAVVLAAWRDLKKKYGDNAGCVGSLQCRQGYREQCFSYCAVLPVPSIALATAVRDGKPLLYVGGGGKLDLYDVDDLNIELGVTPVPLDSFQVAPASGDYDLMTIDLIVEGDLVVALMLGGVGVNDSSFSRGGIPASLALIGLSRDGKMDKLLSNTPLPPELTSSLYFSLERIGDLVVVKSNVVTTTEVTNDNGQLEETFVPGDVRVAVLDVADPERPEVILETRFEHGGKFAMTGLATAVTDGQRVPLVPTADGLVTLQVTVGGSGPTSFR